MKTILVIASVFCLFLAGCGGGAAPTSAPPTNAPAPTQAVQPTNAPAPTQAPGSTQAPAATNAPAPTDVPAQPTTAPEATAAAQPTTAGADVQPPTGDPFDILKTATLAELQSKSFRGTTTIVSSDGKTSQIVIEYVSPDRIHFTSPSGEQIAIKGKGGWTKRAGKWTATPAGSEDVFFQAFSPEGIDAVLKAIQVKSVKLIGPDLIDGKPMFVYQYDTLIDLGTNQSIKGSNKIWIGALDHRAYRAEGVSDSMTKPGTQDKTTAVYEYDVPITIEPPI